jgi:hypothetical protein
MTKQPTQSIHWETIQAYGFQKTKGIKVMDEHIDEKVHRFRQTDQPE